MNHLLASLVITALVLIATGCPSGKTPATNSGSSSTKIDNSKHDHDHGSGHHHEGERHNLGGKDIGGVMVTVTQIGDLEKDKDSVYEIIVGAKVKAVRGWLGKADKTGGAVGKAEQSPDQKDWDLHLEKLKEIPADYLLWIELEKEDGSKAVGSFKPKLE